MHLQYIKISNNKWYYKTNFQIHSDVGINKSWSNIKYDSVNKFIRLNNTWNSVYSYSFVTTSNWTTCTANCDGGTQDLIKKCKRNDGTYVHNNYCIESKINIPTISGATMYNEKTQVRYRQACKTHPCLTTRYFTVQHDCGTYIRPIQVNATGSSTKVNASGAQVDRSPYGLKDYTYMGNTCGHCSWNGNPQKIKVLLSEYIREGAPAPFGFFVDFNSNCRGSNYVKLVDVSSNLRVFSLVSLDGSGNIPPASNTSAWREAYPYCWGGPSCRVIRHGSLCGDSDSGSITFYVTPK